MSKSNRLNILLRIVLAVVGALVIFLGLNVGIGGIPTLGWQGPSDFINVTIEHLFAAQNSHVRFLGGFWLGGGLILLAAAMALGKFKSAAITVCAMAFVGGIIRVIGADTSVLFSAAIAPSLGFELVGFPLLAVWIYRSA